MGEKGGKGILNLTVALKLTAHSKTLQVYIILELGKRNVTDRNSKNKEQMETELINQQMVFLLKHTVQFHTKCTSVCTR